jgi:hypothetical protein
MSDVFDQLKNNCVLVSLAALTGKTLIQLVGEIALTTEVEPVIDEDGLIDRMSYVRYLRGLGWKDCWLVHGTLPSAIPMTCMCVLGPAEEGHAFAIVDGKLYDNGTHSRWGREIIAVFVPPTERKAE